MSTAAAADAVPAPKGKKKLILIIAAVSTVLLLGGGVAVVMMKKSAAAAAEAEAAADEDGEPAAPKAKAAAKSEPAPPPVFVPLDPFTVNLADRDAERYAQVAVTLQIADPKFDAEIKLYMPAIRNNVLMAISERTAGELMSREGKAELAAKIRREVARALGHEVEEPVAGAAEPADSKAARKRRKAEAELPVKAVHFNNFIIQ